MYSYNFRYAIHLAFKIPRERVDKVIFHCKEIPKLRTKVSSARSHTVRANGIRYLWTVTNLPIVSRNYDLPKQTKYSFPTPPPPPPLHAPMQTSVSLETNALISRECLSKRKDLICTAGVIGPSLHDLKGKLFIILRVSLDYATFIRELY